MSAVIVMYILWDKVHEQLKEMHQHNNIAMTASLDMVFSFQEVLDAAVDWECKFPGVRRLIRVAWVRCCWGYNNSASRYRASGEPLMRKELAADRRNPPLEPQGTAKGLHHKPQLFLGLPRRNGDSETW
jgi:hypothetical protein